MRAKIYQTNLNNMDIIVVNLANTVRAEGQIEVVSDAVW